MQLHKHDVVEAATAILDSYGIADLTMRRLAKELNVSPGALYWHFANKQQLLGAIADRILQPAREVPAAADWRAAIVAVCTALRNALLSHTDGAELVSASLAAGQSDAAGDILSTLSRAAEDAGATAVEAELAARTVIYYVLGFTVDEQSRLQWDSAGVLDPDQSVAAVDHDRRFGFGLRLLIDGLGVISPVS